MYNLFCHVMKAALPTVTAATPPAGIQDFNNPKGCDLRCGAQASSSVCTRCKTTFFCDLMSKYQQVAWDHAHKQGCQPFVRPLVSCEGLAQPVFKLPALMERLNKLTETNCSRGLPFIWAGPEPRFPLPAEVRWLQTTIKRLMFQRWAGASIASRLVRENFTKLLSAAAKRRRCSAAVQIQAAFRSSVLRRSYVLRRGAAIKIQTAVRTYIARRDCRRTCRETIVKVQAAVRGFCARQKARSLGAVRARLSSAVVKIQAAFRSLAPHRDYLLRRGATITIQAALRSFLVRRRYLRCRRAAAKVQAAVRGFCARRKARSFGAAAMRIQAAFRAHLASRQAAVSRLLGVPADYNPLDDNALMPSTDDVVVFANGARYKLLELLPYYEDDNKSTYWTIDTVVYEAQEVNPDGSPADPTMRLALKINAPLNEVISMQEIAKMPGSEQYTNPMVNHCLFVPNCKFSDPTYDVNYIMVSKLLVGDADALEERDGKSEQMITQERIRALLTMAELFHRAGKLHRDLKPDNLIFQGAKITALDWEQSLAVGKVMGIGGTPGYQGYNVVKNNLRLRVVESMEREGFSPESLDIVKTWAKAQGHARISDDLQSIAVIATIFLVASHYEPGKMGGLQCSAGGVCVYNMDTKVTRIQNKAAEDCLDDIETLLNRARFETWSGQGEVLKNFRPDAAFFREVEEQVLKKGEAGVNNLCSLLKMDLLTVQTGLDAMASPNAESFRQGADVVVRLMEAANSGWTATLALDHPYFTAEVVGVELPVEPDIVASNDDIFAPGPELAWAGVIMTSEQSRCDFGVPEQLGGGAAPKQSRFNFVPTEPELLPVGGGAGSKQSRFTVTFLPDAEPEQLGGGAGPKQSRFTFVPAEQPAGADNVLGQSRYNFGAPEQLGGGAAPDQALHNFAPMHLYAGVVPDQMRSGGSLEEAESGGSRFENFWSSNPPMA